MPFKRLLPKRPTKHVILFIPGWGFWGEILGPIRHLLLLQAGILLPKAPSWRIPFKIYLDVVQDMAYQGKTVHILGWSLGAIIAHRLQKEISTRSKIQSVLLISPRRCYTRNDTATLRAILKEDKARCLRLFYRDCFAGHSKAIYGWFKERLEGVFIERSVESSLTQGLDFLEANPIPSMAKGNSRRVHAILGKMDRIAPPSLAPKRLPGTQVSIIDGAGHLPFLSPWFKRWIRLHLKHI